MNDIRDIFISKYLKSGDLNGDTTVTITGIEPVIVGWGKKKAQKPLLWFAEFDKGLVVGALNVDTIGDLLDTYKPDDWIGKQIMIYPSITSLGEKKNVPCIRVREQRPVKAEARRDYTPRFNGSPVVSKPNGQSFPPATQADQLLSDADFQRQLDQAFTARGFNSSETQAATEYARTRMDVKYIYDLQQNGRNHLISKIKSGQLDRFKKAPVHEAVA